MSHTHSLLFDSARALGLPVDQTRASILNSKQISACLQHAPPYQALTQVLLLGDGASLLAEAQFPPDICKGHYQACPSIPLVDMGRAMDEAAAILLHHTGEVALLKRIAKLRAESNETANPGVSYLIHAYKSNRETVTKLYSPNLVALATIQGWEYDYALKPVVSQEPAFESLCHERYKKPIQWTDTIAFDEIIRLIPQLPPFLRLTSARRGTTNEGVPVLETKSNFLPSQVLGHFSNETVLGPMHYSRSLAQSGMVAACLFGGRTEVIPEVVSAKTIWYDTHEYFRHSAEVETLINFDRAVTKGGVTFVTINGIVRASGKPVLGTDSFVYVLIPCSQHPATKHDHHA